ncbi:MAG: type II toxin-antitoxin system VapC family toxin [Chloroflexia bacterium]|nr:type II toxin-antitoxin system VapC family toxin [Chloroflexia bacterium]
MSGPAPAGDVYLDTSIVVAASIEGSHHATSCAAFCDDLVAAASRVLFSQVLRLELSQAILKVATRRQGLSLDIRNEFRLDEWGASSAVRERWLRSNIRRSDAPISRFAAWQEIPIGTDTWQTSLDVMIAYGLQSHDAVHVATARQLGLTHLATADDHFKRVSSEFNIILIQDAAYP